MPADDAPELSAVIANAVHSNMNGHHAMSTAITTSYTTAPPASPTSIKTSTIRPPLTEVSPTNQTGVIAILTGFSLGLLLLSILVRLYPRRNARLQSCDCAFYLAVVFGLAEVSTTAWLISIGLGKNIDMLDEVAIRVVERGALATRMSYLLTLWLSKVSCALMIVWLTPFDKQRRAAWGLIALSTIGIVSSLFLEGFGCHDLLGQCHGFRGRWVYISVLDMVLEVLLVGASVYMVWGRSMSTSAKVTVAGAFACRLPYVPPCERCEHLSSPFLASSSQLLISADAPQQRSPHPNAPPLPPPPRTDNRNPHISHPCNNPTRNRLYNRILRDPVPTTTDAELQERRYRPWTHGCDL